MRTARGATRLVVLTRRYAIKLPTPVHGYRNFLYGLLANMQERTFGRTGWPELCPVLFSLPGGWLVVMPRLDPVPAGTWPFTRLDRMPEALFDQYSECGDHVIPVENKRDSFGLMGNQIVAVDYGGWGN